MIGGSELSPLLLLLNGSVTLATTIAHLPSLAREATTEVMLSLECENGGQYLEPQENWVATLTGSGFSIRSGGAKLPISACESE